MVIFIKFDDMQRFLILFALASIISSQLKGQNEEVPGFEDTMAVYEDLFDIREPLTLTLRFDIKEFQKTKHKGKYQPAVLTCHVREGFDVTHNVRVRARGEYRLNTCFWPPFWPLARPFTPCSTSPWGRIASTIFDGGIPCGRTPSGSIGTSAERRRSSS